MPAEQYFVYPTNPDGKRILYDPVSGDEVDVDPGRVVRDVRDQKGKAYRDWMLHSSFRLMRVDDLVWFYAAGAAELYALAYVKRVYDNGSEWRLEVEWDVAI